MTLTECFFGVFQLLICCYIYNNYDFFFVRFCISVEILFVRFGLVDLLLILICFSMIFPLKKSCKQISHGLIFRAFRWIQLCMWSFHGWTKQINNHICCEQFHFFLYFVLFNIFISFTWYFYFFAFSVCFNDILFDSLHVYI